VSWPIQDHADWVIARLKGDATLAVYDGEVPDAPAKNYVLVYLYVQTPDGLAAPDKVRLSGDSDVIDLWIYCHCVGPTPVSARAMSGRVRARLLNARPVIAGRTCFPVRWREGQPPQRNEEIPGATVMDQVDVYGLMSVPASA
jgi:hypothetical protein